jgi:hypothetical protein
MSYCAPFDYTLSEGKTETLAKDYGIMGGLDFSWRHTAIRLANGAILRYYYSANSLSPKVN